MMDDICNGCIKREVCYMYIEYCQCRNTIRGYPRQYHILLSSHDIPHIVECPAYCKKPQEAPDA